MYKWSILKPVLGVDSVINQMRTRIIILLVKMMSVLLIKPIRDK